MTMADGSIIEASAAPKARTRISVPTHSEAQRLVSSTSRKLLEMPALPKQMNGVAVVLVYTASGLSTGEIAIATGLSHDQITAIRDGAVYKQLESYMVEAVKAQSATTVADILARGEVAAANRLVDLVTSDNEVVGLAATRDMLDRRGHGAKQIVDIRNSQMSTLRIEVVDKRDVVQAPVIDMEMEP